MSDLIYIVSTESKEWSGWVNGKFWNIQKLTKEMNQVVKPAEIRALDNALRKMDKRGKSLLEELLGM